MIRSRWGSSRVVVFATSWLTLLYFVLQCQLGEQGYCNSGVAHAAPAPTSTAAAELANPIVSELARALARSDLPEFRQLLKQMEDDQAKP